MQTLHHNLMENLREIQQIHPDAHFITRKRPFLGTEVIATFKVGRFDAFVPMTCISDLDASPEQVEKIFCNE